MTVTNSKKTALPTSECTIDLKHLSWDIPRNLVLVKVSDNRATWYKHDTPIVPGNIKAYTKKSKKHQHPVAITKAEELVTV